MIMNKHGNVLICLLALFIAACGTTLVVQAYAISPLHQSHRFPNSRLITTSSPLTITKAAVEDGSINENDRTSAKYHLIWSEKFGKRMLTSTVVWMMVHYIFAKKLEKILFSTPKIVLPLLSSSCCAIQLLINTISGIGCAGFNTYLGPIRPILLPVLLLSTWKLLSQRSLEWTIISLLLAFLPEMVDVWNKIRQIQQKQSYIDDFSTSLPISAKLRLNCPTMGCVACVNKIDSSIRQCKFSSANIKEETSWLTNGSEKGGMAEMMIQGKNNDEIDDVVKEVMSALEKAGFKCTVKSLIFR